MFLALVFQSIWYTKGNYDYYINDETLMNAAAIMYQNLSAGGILLMIIVAIITGTAIYKDMEFKTAQCFYSFPIGDKTFFIGKFFAAYFINIILCTGLIIGMCLVQFTGMAPASKFGPLPIGQILHGFALFTLPNIFLLTSISIFCVVYFKNMTASYLGVFLIIISFLVGESTRENSAYGLVNILIDPFAFGTVKETLDSATVGFKNFGYLSLSGHLLINRFFWFVISFILFFLSYRKFTFKYFVQNRVKKNKTEDYTFETVTEKISKNTSQLRQYFSWQENIKKLWRLTNLEIKNIIGPISFKIIMGMIAIMFLTQNLLYRAEYLPEGMNDLPITSSMTYFRLPLGVILIMLVAVWGVELFYKNRTVNIWQITDALPVPTWLQLIPKLLATYFIAFLMVSLIFVVGVICQLLEGFTDMDWQLYLNDIYGAQMGWLSYLLWISLAFFIGSIFRNRLTGHIITVGLLFFYIVAGELGIVEQHRFAYGFTAGEEEYSEMNGYGIYAVTTKWMFLMWSFLAFAMVLMAVWFWNRGTLKTLVSRTSFKNTQLNLFGKSLILICLIGFVSLQFYIFNQMNVKGNFVLKSDELKSLAKYEKTYRYLKFKPHPKYKNIDISVDLFPEKRTATYEIKAQLINQSISRIDTLYLNIKDFTELESVSNGQEKLKLLFNDKEQNIQAYLLPQSLQPNDSTIIVYKAKTSYSGFSQNDPQSDLAFNGTLLGRDIIPKIGFEDSKKILVNRDREQNGLAKLNSRMASVDDSTALSENYLSPDVLAGKYSFIISTSNDQVPFASGVLVKEWSDKDRNYAKYESIHPQIPNWKIGSAKYKTVNSVVQINTTKIPLKIMHHPSHTYQLGQFEKATFDAVKFINLNLGKWMPEQLIIAEIPYYENTNFSFANVICINEKKGWYAKGKNEKEVYFIYYQIVRELMSMYLQSKIKVANVQGATMLTNALPDALAMKFIQLKFGDEIVQKIINQKESNYKKGRGLEPNSEPSLLYADGADYLEQNKGAIVLYETIQEIGFENFNKIFLQSITENNGMKTFKDFITSFRPLLTTNTYNKYLKTE
jgi:ABC-type transport system involved in multi-copper enzyme maturation permease subunit